MARRLRSGYTTGACAAAAAKAALLYLHKEVEATEVDIPFPDSTRHTFQVYRTRQLDDGGIRASIIKDAGDDPDVTNGAEIAATVRYLNSEEPAAEGSVSFLNILLIGGEGVGRVTKPGLAVAVGEPAINPVPRKMIGEAIQEVEPNLRLEVIVSVTDGEALAEKTLNKRLGIIGGLSILGTTGIVRPVSADAWTATIKASMDVAREAGLSQVVLSTGRTSERGAQTYLDLDEEAYVMMGDYLHFSLKEAMVHGFNTIHFSGMWAKITKAALKVPQTHVRNGALEMAEASELLASLGADGPLLARIEQSNTAREMYEHLDKGQRKDIIRSVCKKAGEYGREVSGKRVTVYLVNHKAEVVEIV